MFDLIEACVRKMLAQVSNAERSTNHRLRRKTAQLLTELGELRIDLEDEMRRGTHESTNRRETR